MKENQTLNGLGNSDLFKRETVSFNLINNKSKKPLLIKKQRMLQKSLSSQAFFDTYSVQNVDPIDLENLNENINKAKHQYHKKNRELVELKTLFRQLKNESNNHIRVIEAILSKNNTISNSLSNLSPPLLESTKMNESNGTIVVQPDDSKFVSNLKYHLIESKAELNEWIKEYEIVNQSEKVIQMREIENKLAQCEEAIKTIEYNNKQLQNSICEIHRKLTDSINLESNHKSNANQMQFSIREANNQIEILKNAYTLLEVSISQHEQIMEKNKINIIQLIEQIKQREDLIDKCNQQKSQIEGLKTEKANYEKRMKEIQKKIRMTMVDIEKAQKRNKDLENNKEYLTQKMITYEKERPKVASYSKESVLSFRDKDKMIKDLQKEHDVIRKNKEFNKKKGNEKMNEMTEHNKDSKEEIENTKKEIEDLNDNTKSLETNLLNKKKQLNTIENSDRENAKRIIELSDEIIKAQNKRQIKPKEEYITLIKEKKNKDRLLEEEIKGKKDAENKYIEEKNVLMNKISEKNKQIQNLKEMKEKLENQKGQ